MSSNPLWFALLLTEIDAPKDLKAADVKMESAALSWIHPLADIEGYVLTYRDEAGNIKVLVWFKIHISSRKN